MFCEEVLKDRIFCKVYGFEVGFCSLVGIGFFHVFLLMGLGSGFSLLLPHAKSVPDLWNPGKKVKFF